MARIALVRLRPLVNHPLLRLAIVANLQSDIRMGMAVVAVAPFVFLVYPDKNFFIHPRLDRGVGLVVAFEFHELAVVFKQRGLLVVLHDESGDFQGPVLHPLDIEIGFGPDLVLGGAIFRRRVCIRVMGRASMAAGHHNPLARLFLDIIKQLDQDRIDPFLARNDWKPMPPPPLTIGKRPGFRHAEERVGRIAFAAEILAGDLGEVRLGFPRIDGSWRMLRCGKGIQTIFRAAVDRLGRSVAAPDLFFFGLLEARTRKGEAEYS